MQVLLVRVYVRHLWRVEGFVNLLDWWKGHDSHPKGVDELESHLNQAT